MKTEKLTKAMHTANLLRQDIRDLLNETTPCSEAERWAMDLLMRRAAWIENQLKDMLKENSSVDTAPPGR